MDTPTGKCVKTLARSRGSAKIMACRVLKNCKVLQWVVKGIGQLVKYELSSLCPKKHNSVLRCQLTPFFPWKNLHKEIVQQLNEILLSATALKESHANRN
jgi:hypothetical protein